MAIDFTLSQQQRMLQSKSREFAAEVLAPAKDAEMQSTPEQRFLATRPAYEAMVKEGFLRRCIPSATGGDSAGLVDLAIMIEELYSGNASLTLTMLGTVLGLLPILRAGTQEQRDRLLSPFLKTTGAPLAAFCSTEPGGSANAASPPPGDGVRTLASHDGKNWVINGEKKWVSSATGWDRQGADLLCVVCRTDPGALPESGISIIAVECPTPGLALERAIDSVGHRAHLLPQFRLADVRAPANNLIGEEGGGLAVAAASFVGMGALVGIFGVALIRAAFDFTLQFARTERRGAADPIIEHPVVGYALADAKTVLDSTRFLSWAACHAVDTRAAAAAELDLQAKIYGSEAAVRVITDLMRVVGVDSYDHNLPLAQLLQDALALPVFGGGNVGVRRRQLHTIMKQPDYDPLATCSAA